MNQEIELKSPKASFLGIKDIVSDIKAMPKWFQILLIVGSVLIIFFNFFDVQGGGDKSFFMPINQYNSVLAVDEAGNFLNYSTFGNTVTGAIIVTTFYSLNGIAAFSGLLAVAMIVFIRPSQYFWISVNALTLGLFVLSVGYVGDFFMNMIKLTTAIPGWWLITTIFKNNKLPDRGKWFRFSFWTGIIFITLFIILMWLFFIPEAAKWIFGNDRYMEMAPAGEAWGVFHILDGMSSGSQTVGWTLQILNLGEQFYVWAIADFFNFLKYTDIAPGTLSINMLIQFGVFITFDLTGLYERVLRPILITKGWIKVKESKAKILVEQI